MLISVINQSSRSDREVQGAIRAINRQIADDFEPHWHTGGRLRLDGAPAGRGEPVREAGARGDAVIYLCDEIAVDQALAYHRERNPELPCGFVFVDLARQLGEPWTVSLSHEALDLIADPAVNLLVAGPHPAAADREVFFWRQVCDAVQGEQYEIDGVAVCDFVLPRYFAADGADGARCDFAGARDRRGAALPPFGLAAGGCAGFYDPATGDHDVAVADELAEKRRRLESGGGLARRARRHARRAERPQAPGDVRLEAFAIQASASDDPEAAVRRAADSVLGPSWQVRRLLRDSLTFEASHPTATLDPADAWDRAYQMGRAEHIASAEPLFEVRMREGEAEATVGPRAERLALAPATRDLSSSTDVEWAIKMIDAPEAWGLFGPTGRLPGEGIVIGHPDTGYTRHPEIFPGRIRLDGAYDFFTDDGDPTDELLEGGTFATPGHGTATSSVIVSDWGAQRPASGPYVTGVAPRASVVPFRVMKSPVLWSTRNVTAAIDRAAAIGCHVISMSLGTGLWWEVDALREAIRRAVRRGVIVVAAAGNYVGPVTWPGRFDEVVCVAACNAARRPWFHSCAGSAVDVTAPGESVWRARAGKRQGGPHFDVARSSGTSFSTAMVAGVAALWLSYHGRDQLIAAFGVENLGPLFRAVARASCMPMVGVPDHQRNDFGAGIINARAVLAVDPRAVATGMRSLRATEVARKVEGDQTAEFVRELQREPARLAAALGVGPDGLARLLDARGKEIALRLATEPSLRQALSAARAGAAAPPALAGAVVSLSGASQELRDALAAARPKPRTARPPSPPVTAAVRNGGRRGKRPGRPRPQA